MKPFATEEHLHNVVHPPHTSEEGIRCTLAHQAAGL